MKGQRIVRRFQIRDLDLVTLVTRGYESKDLDYKSPLLWDEGEKRDCCALVKDILAIANHGGGFLVIGVAEPEPNNFEPVGLTKEQLDSFEGTRLSRFANRYASPTVNVTCRRIEHEGRYFVVIDVTGFPDTPHICTKSFEDVLTAPTLYVRTDNNESAPVSQASDVQRMIERALRNRADTLLGSVRAVLAGVTVPPTPASEKQFAAQVEDAESQFSRTDPYADKGYQGYIEVSCQPATFEAERFTFQQLRDAAEAARVLYRGRSFLYTSPRQEEMHAFADGVECSVTDPYERHDNRDFWRLYRSGLFFHKRVMWEETAKGQKTLDLVSFICHVAEAVDALVRLYTSLELPPEDGVSACFRVTDADGRMLVSYDPSRGTSAEWVSHVARAEVRRLATLAEWRGGLRDYAVELARDMFARFNWFDASPQVLREIVDTLLDRKI